MKNNNLLKALWALVAALLVLVSFAETAQAAPAQSARRGARIIITFRNIPAEDKPNVDGDYIVSQDDGSISIPYLSSRIRAEGKTGRQLEEIIRARFIEEQIYSQPIVSVQVGSIDEINALNQRYVQVTGYVAQKRNLPYRPDLTLIAAIVDCGDITDHGSREIQVTRGNQTQTYDYFSAKDRAIKLRPNDVIFVKLRGPFEGRPSKIGP
ncbi:MAG: polysaccharide biosynthesis/export family protein [Akkermansia sp.]|nr:polysaccharide biosynthesis/export family protein [Akkermansia sp.]